MRMQAQASKQRLQQISWPELENEQTDLVKEVLFVMLSIKARKESLILSVLAQIDEIAIKIQKLQNDIPELELWLRQEVRE